MRRIDPIAAVIGGVSTVAAIVFGVPVFAALGIGIVTTGVASAGQVLAARRAEPKPSWEAVAEPPTPLHEQEQRWIDQAAAAVSAIRRGVRALPSGPLQQRLGGVASKAEGVLDDLRRVAEQVAATRRASGQLDLPRLSTDLSRLTSTMERSGDPDVARDLHRSVEAVREQLRIGRRLASARVALQTRIEAGTLGLQQLAAQVGEMSALAPLGGDAWSHGGLIDELTTQLDALRAGLGDATVMSSTALRALDMEGGDDVPIDA